MLLCVWVMWRCTNITVYYWKWPPLTSGWCEDLFTNITVYYWKWPPLTSPDAALCVGDMKMYKYYSILLKVTTTDQSRSCFVCGWCEDVCTNISVLLKVTTTDQSRCCLVCGWCEDVQILVYYWKWPPLTSPDAALCVGDVKMYVQILQCIIESDHHWPVQMLPCVWVMWRCMYKYYSVLLKVTTTDQSRCCLVCGWCEDVCTNITVYYWKWPPLTSPDAALCVGDVKMYKYYSVLLKVTTTDQSRCCLVCGWCEDVQILQCIIESDHHWPVQMLPCVWVMWRCMYKYYSVLLKVTTTDQSRCCLVCGWCEDVQILQCIIESDHHWPVQMLPCVWVMWRCMYKYYSVLLKVTTTDQSRCCLVCGWCEDVQILMCIIESDHHWPVQMLPCVWVMWRCTNITVYYWKWPPLTSPDAALCVGDVKMYKYYCVLLKVTTTDQSRCCLVCGWDGEVGRLDLPHLDGLEPVVGLHAAVVAVVRPGPVQHVVLEECRVRLEAGVRETRANLKHTQCFCHGSLTSWDTDFIFIKTFQDYLSTFLSTVMLMLCIELLGNADWDWSQIKYVLYHALLFEGTRCSSVVRAFAHGVMGRPIDPSWWTHWAISCSS